jgi:hypothetical protein
MPSNKANGDTYITHDDSLLMPYLQNEHYKNEHRFLLSVVVSIIFGCLF